MHTTTETLGRRLKRLRGNRRIEEVAAATGLSYRALQNLEGDLYEPQLRTLRRLATFHRQTLAELVDGTERAS